MGLNEEHSTTVAKIVAEELGEEMEAWLAASGVSPDATVRAVIAPHAGFRYSGRCAAYAFAHMHAPSIRRIFLLGPSHHHYTRKCVLPRSTSFHTPLGALPIDMQVVEELKATGEFEEMGRHVDEAEHSLEMHAPFLAHMCKDHNVSLVPIMVGSLDAAAEARYGSILSRYFSDSSNFFSISSDFCHWGSRFRFTPYDKAHGPIHKAIEAMDREGMAAIEGGGAKAFRDYIERTGNTVCGRHPIGVLLQVWRERGWMGWKVAGLDGRVEGGGLGWVDGCWAGSRGVGLGRGVLPVFSPSTTHSPFSAPHSPLRSPSPPQMAELCPSPPSIRFVQYEQSSHCHSMRDSSVSYASAVLTLTPPST
ncbi:unnamed protein product [Closterium sp. Naga37s-1]|nr:unnamed protein product [Closterium sp. Naga37s-1]